MARRPNRQRIHAARRAGRGQIRVDPANRGNVPRGTKPITEFPDYNPRLNARKLRLCMDEDTGCLREALDNLNVSQRWVADDPELQGRDDRDIARWARQNGHIVVTFNVRDYWREKQGFHLHQCPGIIALAMANNGVEAGPAARLIANFIMQVGHKVPVSWWQRTKIKVTGEHYLIRRSVAGQMLEYKIYEASNAALCFRQTRR